MLTHAELVALHRSLCGERVLSVYIDGTAQDPALQRSWRLQLEHSLNAVRLALEAAPHEEREQFERCVRLLDARLDGIQGSIGAPGWAAFVTVDGVQVAHRIPAPALTRAAWTKGPSLAPYVRALRVSRPVVVALVDARRAVLSQYSLGVLHRIETIHAHHVVEPPAHMGAAPRPGFHAGTRGATGHDAAQRSLLEGRNRMLAQAAKRVNELAGPDGWIVLGGIHGIVKRLAQRLASAKGRVLETESLDVHAVESDIARAARNGTEVLRDAADLQRVRELEEQTGAHALAVLGPSAARHALEGASCRELLLTHRYIVDRPTEADDAVRLALEQDATVTEVSGEAADVLDQCGGMAAGLRFRPTPVESVASNHEAAVV